MWEGIGIKNKTLLDRADKAYRKWAKRKLRDGSFLGWLAETPEHHSAGGGCLWLRPEQPRPRLKGLVEPYLLSMYTEPQFRRRGIASKILEEAIKWCKKNGYHRLILHASNQGRSLYRKYGFVRTREMRLNFG
jgi:GNAT superfamily N-acetyltransferase